MMAAKTLSSTLLPREEPVGVNEGTICTTTIAVWCNDGKRSPACVWYQAGILIPKVQLYLIAESPALILAGQRHPDPLDKSSRLSSQHHKSTQKETLPEECSLNITYLMCDVQLNSSIQIEAQKVSASYFLWSCTQYPGLQKCHLSVKHKVGLIFLRASGWCSCTNIRQHYYLLFSKQE